MIATESDKKAIVIDPTCEIDNVISKIVNENGLKITEVIDTHMHADLIWCYKISQEIWSLCVCQLIGRL
jgi:glyoxylase-like metal-dependent hydrolase (beta-lactamase superfamily II)